MGIYAADIMCGIGGATRGFLDAGIHVLRGVDIDGSCKKTYEENNKPAKFLNIDVRQLSANILFEEFKPNEADKIVLIVCAPCQPFSRAGAKKPKNSGSLISAIADLIYEIKPDFVFAENVPGFQKFYPSIYEEFLRPYKEMGYHYNCDVVNLKKYGVPQNRSRYVFLASRDFEIDLPENTHGARKGVLPYVTVQNTIEKYPALEAGTENKEFPNHICANLAEITLERLRHTPENGGSRSAWPSHLVLNCHKATKGHSDVYGRMTWEKIGPTLTCRCISVSNGRFAHPVQNRGISLREAAALQTFRDNFIFYENMNLAAKHIGNAVPPQVGFLFAQKIISIALQKNQASLHQQSPEAIPHGVGNKEQGSKRIFLQNNIYT
jgi:DNA (cytosine-5)-methyltransferase 1